CWTTGATPTGFLVEHFAGGDMFDSILKPGWWAPFTVSGLAQRGPPASPRGDLNDRHTVRRQRIPQSRRARAQHHRGRHPHPAGPVGRAPGRGAHRQVDRGALRQRLALKRGRIVAAGTGIRQRFGSRRRLPAVGPRTDGHLKSCPGSTTIPPKTSAHLARDDPTRGGPGGRRKPNPHTAYLTLLRFSCRGRNPACKPAPQSASRGP